MRSCDVAVVGLGLMGSAALDALLGAGVDALGFDSLGPGATRGSSHGSCRVFRRFNFENENYTDLSDAAHAGWTRLEAESGQSILIPCPVLEAGRPGSGMVAASRAAAIAKNHPDPVRSAKDVNREFPAFALPADWDVVVQDGGAILKSDLAMRIMRARAGAHVIAEAAKIEQRADGVLLRTKTQQVLAQRVILALGPCSAARCRKSRRCLKLRDKPSAGSNPPGRRRCFPADSRSSFSSAASTIWCMAFPTSSIGG
jgi:sarcosine oxidase